MQQSKVINHVECVIDGGGNILICITQGLKLSFASFGHHHFANLIPIDCPTKAPLRTHLCWFQTTIVLSNILAFIVI